MTMMIMTTKMMTMEMDYVDGDNDMNDAENDDDAQTNRNS